LNDLHVVNLVIVHHAVALVVATLCDFGFGGLRMVTALADYTVLYDTLFVRGSDFLVFRWWNRYFVRRVLLIGLQLEITSTGLEGNWW